MLPSITASSSGHWNHEGSRRWQRATVPSAATRTQASTSPRKPSASAMPSHGAPRQHAEDLLDQDEALLDLADADPDARIDVAGGQHRHIEAQRRIGRVAGRLACIVGAARRAPDIAAAAELAGQLGLEDSGA